MTLQGRVGRHIKTGQQCQNHTKDQMAVITMLNSIPTTEGGAGGGIPISHVIDGMSSPELYNAILRFQEKQFPAQVTGFVDPGSPLLTKMETLASRPAPSPPKPAGQWDDFKSESVHRALADALSGDDRQLTQAKVVDIIGAALRDGSLSDGELSDLRMIIEKSRSIWPRSKKMLQLFIDKAKYWAKLGPYKLPTSRHLACAELIFAFLKRSGTGQWTKLDRDEVGVGLLMRLAYPGLLRQGDAQLCGPAAFLFGMLADNPGSYTKFAIDMYEKGTALIGMLPVSPGKSVRNYQPPSSAIDEVDWLTMASLRDSENSWYLPYSSVDDSFAGATTPFEMHWWFTKAGYSDVKEDANLAVSQGNTDNMDEASRLFSAGYRVALLIDYQMIEADKQSQSGSKIALDRHWIVLQSKIDRSGGNVRMTIFTWGDANRQVPTRGVLPVSDFLMNYYGYVAGKP